MYGMLSRAPTRGKTPAGQVLEEVVEHAEHDLRPGTAGGEAGHCGLLECSFPRGGSILHLRERGCASDDALLHFVLTAHPVSPHSPRLSIDLIGPTLEPPPISANAWFPASADQLKVLSKIFTGIRNASPSHEELRRASARMVLPWSVQQLQSALRASQIQEGGCSASTLWGAFVQCPDVLAPIMERAASEAHEYQTWPLCRIPEESEDREALIEKVPKFAPYTIRYLANLFVRSLWREPRKNSYSIVSRARVRLGQLLQSNSWSRSMLQQIPDHHTYLVIDVPESECTLTFGVFVAKDGMLSLNVHDQVLRRQAMRFARYESRKPSELVHQQFYERMDTQFQDPVPQGFFLAGGHLEEAQRYILQEILTHGTVTDFFFRDSTVEVSREFRDSTVEVSREYQYRPRRAGKPNHQEERRPAKEFAKATLINCTEESHVAQAIRDKAREEGYTASDGKTIFAVPCPANEKNKLEYMVSFKNGEKKVVPKSALTDEATVWPAYARLLTFKTNAPYTSLPLLFAGHNCRSFWQWFQKDPASLLVEVRKWSYLNEARREPRDSSAEEMERRDVSPSVAEKPVAVESTSSGAFF